MDSFKKIQIVEYRNSSLDRATDSVATEKRLKIFSVNKEILSLLCSPSMIRELVIGFALSEGFIGNRDNTDQNQTWCAERIEILWKDKEIEVNLPVDLPESAPTLTSGCGKGITFISDEPLELPAIKDDLMVGVNDIFERYKEFQKKSELFRLTGGVHSAALSDGQEIIVFAEDIGRHNAVDKVIGYAFLENIPLKGKILLLSGRISSEIATKAVRAQVPMIVSRAAPTDMSIEIARKTGLTLIGFLRGRQMNIYSKPEKIIL